MKANVPLLQVENLRVSFPVRGGLLGLGEVGAVHAVDDLSFCVKAGETFGIVGESGCGKSTLGLALMRMLDRQSGRIVFAGSEVSALEGRALQNHRRNIQMIYQDPFGSLNPRMRVLDLIGEPLVVHRLYNDRQDYRDQVLQLMEMVGLKPEMAERYAHEFSGGQRQRIGIARALAAKPRVIVCDEAVSALDVSIQAQVINLLQDLQDELGLTYVFISHDLSVVRHICDRIMVMYLGRAVETGERDALYDDPHHPYTQALLTSAPIPDPDPAVQAAFQVPLRGEIPSPVDRPSGCFFHTRCPKVMPVCREKFPQMRTVQNGNAVACHLYADTTRAALHSRTGGSHNLKSQ